ncbi:hypothetical protein CHS0354_021932 [Potamilus streckersoni]|uniref:Uncharacterized protein n=1 Tax=Potamilus streckersoni TaxID=2493646 RepID=A0AAE0SK18_9BIVA|nr:hypothetical protein CHS0354_021932 [Potamilus streckersoni]
MDGTQSEDNKEKSLKLSKFLSAKGLSPLQVDVNRQAIAYEHDILSAFAINDNIYVILSESYGDGVPLFYGYGRVEESSDLDLVVINKDVPVSEIDINDNDWVIKVSDPECIGYARLWVKRPEDVARICEYIGGKYYLSSRLMVERNIEKAQQTFKKVEAHGPALDIDLSPSEVAEMIVQRKRIPPLRIGDPSFTTVSSTGVDKTDHVYCFESESWPAEAEEWKSRQRLFDWPKGDLVELIVQTGCIFAPVGNKESEDDIKRLQWRISFNKAESLLTRSFNETQMCCYVLLKMFNVEILKSVSNKCTTSYIMKITIFWVSESMMQEEWQPKTLISCFLKCISKLRDWITKREMPHYFIMGRNMFVPSELTEQIATDIVLELDKVAKDPFGVLDRLEMVKGFLDAPLDDIESMFMDIVRWLTMRLNMAEHYFFIGNQILYKAHDYKNVPESIHLCEVVLTRLSKLGGYYKPMCDLVKNCLAVLHYANAIKPENADISCSEKEVAMEYFEESDQVDCTHVPLRMATCLIMEKRYSEALLLIKNAIAFYTEHSKMPSIPYQNQFENVLNKVIKDTLLPLKEERRLEELKLIHEIAKNDIQLQDLEQTMLHLANTPKSILMVYSVARKYICFDVIFTSAEISVLPKPVQMEATMKEGEINLVPMPYTGWERLNFEGTFILTLHPGMYAYYLMFLCSFNMERSRGVCKKYLHDMNRAIMEGPEAHKSVGFNILAYCYLQLHMHAHAAQCLIKSLRLNPDVSSVAYSHLQKILGILMTIDISKCDMTDKQQDKEVHDDSIIYQRNY